MEVVETTNSIIEKNFPHLAKYLAPDDVTDLDFNCGNFWITTVNHVPEVIVDENITENMMKRLAITAGTSVGQNFNAIEHTVCADSDNLRLTCLHESQSVSGISVNIRKFKPDLRLTWRGAIESGYATEEILYMLCNCVKAKLSLAYCGMPGSGKTEALRFFSQFIPKYEKVVTIEDVSEIKYPLINPGASCTEIKVRNGNYGECLKTALRINPSWIFFGESRGKEVKYLLESWSNGVPSMTTLHVADGIDVPDRILNMLDDRQDAERIVNQVYRSVGVSVLVKIVSDSNGQTRRYIDQVCFFYRKNGKNVAEIVVDGGKLCQDRVPEFIREEIEASVGHDLFTGPKMYEEAG